MTNAQEKRVNRIAELKGFRLEKGGYGKGHGRFYIMDLVLLSQKVAAFADENHVFGKIQFSACRGLRWVCQNLVTLHHGFRRTSRV
jgi:hypothetical protein